MTRTASILLLLGLTVLGCQSVDMPPRPLSAAQREAMQTKEIVGEYSVVFGAVLSVLQDEGWQIETVDKDSGVIQARSLKTREAWGPMDDWRSADQKWVKEKRRLAQEYRERGNPVDWTRWEELTARVEPWGVQRVRTRISIVRCGSGVL